MPSPKRYTMAQKMQILTDAHARLATGESLKSIARHHNIQPKQLRDWKSKEVRIAACKKGNKSLHRGLQGRLKHIEEPLMAWILELREEGFPLNYGFICIKAAQMDEPFAELPWASQYDTVRRFCINNCLVVRTGTHTAQKHPQKAEELALGWMTVMRPVVSAVGLDKTFFINMDQTPVWMSCHPNKTLNLQGEGTINIRKTGDSGTRFTACLAISANGDKLKPALIFKGEANGRIATREFTDNHAHADSIVLTSKPLKNPCELQY